MVFFGGEGGGNFWSRNFLAFIGPRNFLGFDFCSHSVIPETRSTPPRLGSHFPSMESSKEKSLRHIAMVAKFLGMTTTENVRLKKRIPIVLNFIDLIQFHAFKFLEC